MKVHYKKTILQLIDDEKTKAVKEAKTLGYIELTYAEWTELLNIAEKHGWLGLKLKPNDIGKPIGSITEIYYNGVRLIQETRMV